MEKISWTDHVRNYEVLQRVKEKKNIIRTANRRKADWVGNILHRNCCLKQVVEGKIGEMIEVMGSRGSRSKQLLYDLKEERG